MDQEEEDEKIPISQRIGRRKSYIPFAANTEKDDNGDEVDENNERNDNAEASSPPQSNEEIISENESLKLSENGGTPKNTEADEEKVVELPESKKAEEEKEEELSNKWVWYPEDKVVWSKGIVLGLTYVENPKGPGWKEYLISISDSPPIVRKIKTDRVHRVDPTHLIDLDNICLMNDMHEAPLLDLLKRRFSTKVIYTYTGDVLISINPYETIMGLYDAPMKHFSLQARENPSDVHSVHHHEKDKTLKPHVYQIANKSLTSLVFGNIIFEQDANTIVEKAYQYFNQSIIISGESGAGKTENSKHVVNFLIAANNYLSHESVVHENLDLSEEKFADYLKGILIESSVVLEAFGNAKTVRNDNSSRFGKYIKLMYASAASKNPNFDIPKLYSAVIETFLLEKSRLAYVGQGERSYHIFYQLLSGLSETNPTLASDLSIKSANEFKMLSQGGCYTNQDDKLEYLNTSNALKILRCTDREISEIWKLLMTILHMGNFEYLPPAGDVSDSTVSVQCSTFSLQGIADVLGVGLEQMLASLTTQQLIVMKRSSIKMKILNVAEVANNVFALIKWLYSKLFDWIVSKINFCFSVKSLNTETRKLRTGFIGILDIFGFEILGVNSFEQLCINFTNERLQQQFNEFVFVTEQAMYRQEGLEWSNITFKDNQSIIDLIASTRKPLGLLLLLEEQGMLNRKPDDIALLSTFNQIHEAKDAKGKVLEGNIYSRSRFGKDAFTLKHFAGDVTYAVDGFLMKNNDALQDDLVTLLHTSTNEFLRNVMKFSDMADNPNSIGFIPPLENSALTPLPIESQQPQLSQISQPLARNEPPSRNTGTGKKMASAVSVSLHFRQQLDALMATLTSTSPNYIKCVKPNSLKAKESFDPILVIQQLRYSGVLEVVRIRREGFPVRMSFVQFYKDYEILAKGKPKDLFPGPDKVNFDQAKKCCEIIAQESLPKDAYQIGHSLLFLRQNSINLMQEAITRFYDVRAVKIQSQYRGLLMKRKYLSTLAKIVKIQSHLRRLKQRVVFVKVRHAGLCIKYFYVSKRLRKQFVARYQQMLKEKRELSAVLLQTSFRAFSARKAYKIMYKNYIRMKHRCALFIQCAFRCHRARRRFYHLKRNFSIVKIQSVMRTFLARQQYLLTYAVVIAVQSYFRRFLARIRYQKNLNRIIKAQSLVRAYLSKTFYRKIAIPAVILIQSHARAHIARSNYLMQLVSIICLQNWFRKVVAVQKYNRLKAGVILIQNLIRKREAQRSYQFDRQRVIKVQSVIRRFIQLLRFRYALSSIICLQSFGRMINQRRLYYTFLISSVIIQSITRKFIWRNKFLKERSQVIFAEKLIRGYLARLNYRKQYQAIVKLQSFGRMLNQVRAYNNAFISIVIVQSLARKFLAKRDFLLNYTRILIIQKYVRRFLTRLMYQYQRKCLIKLQAFGRMLNGRRRFDEMIISAIIAQTVIRGFIAKCFYRRIREQMITLQSWYRMKSQKAKYLKIRSQIIKIQSHVRKYQAYFQFQMYLVSIIAIQAIVRRGIKRNKFMLLKISAIYIQCNYRMFIQRKRYRNALRAETQICKTFRAYLYWKRFQQQKKSANRIKIAVRRFLLNLRLYKRLKNFHHLCASTHQGETVPNTATKARGSIVQQVTSVIGNQILQHLVQFPDDRNIRYRYDRTLKTLLHSLILSADDEILKALSFTCKECLEHDISGKNSAHYLGMSPNLNVLRILADSINSFTMKSNAVHMEALDEDEGDDDRNEDENSPTSQLKRALHASVGTSSLKSGWLKKKRGGMMWQKRWVVLTEDYIIYYKNPQSINNPKFAIPLAGCTLQRVPGSKDPIFELLAPNMGEKKSYFGSSTKKSLTFLAESEKDLQEWLLPLKAVAGVGTFRSSAVRYINTDLRKLWLSTLDFEKESPLHCLIKYLSQRMEKVPSLEVIVYVITWFIEFGASVNHQNIRGETPLFIAIANSLDKKIIRALLVKGADPRLPNNKGVSSLDLIASNEEKRKMYTDLLHSLSSAKSVHSAHPERGYLSTGKLKGYSYLSIFFGMQTCNKVLNVSEDPSLVISVYNEKKQILESVTDVRNPAMISVEGQANVRRSFTGNSGGCLFWGQSWHMHTPLENIEPNSYLLIEYRPSGEIPSQFPISALQGQYLIDLNSIDSSSPVIELTPTAEAGKQSNPILVVNEQAFLSVEISITARNRNIDLRTIMCSN